MWDLVSRVRRSGLLFAPETRMDRLFAKKSKKSLKSSQRHIALGIPTGVAVGPLGFQTELDIGPKGERYRPDRDLETGGPDSTVVPDEKDVRASRIVFLEGKSKDQGFAATEVSTAGDATSGPMIMPLPMPLPTEENMSDTREEGGGSVTVSTSTC